MPESSCLEPNGSRQWCDFNPSLCMESDTTSRDTAWAMSQENVEAVRQGYAGFAKDGVEGVIPFFTEDAVIYSIPEWPDDPEYYGHEGLRKLIRQWMESFDDFGLDLRELHDRGDTVVALVELTGQTKGSGLAMRMQIGAVFSGFRDGRVAQQRLFSSWDGALEAVRMQE